jgi:hypothetical protein
MRLEQTSNGLFPWKWEDDDDDDDDDDGAQCVDYYDLNHNATTIMYYGTKMKSEATQLPL